MFYPNGVSSPGIFQFYLCYSGSTTKKFRVDFQMGFLRKPTDLLRGGYVDIDVFGTSKEMTANVTHTELFTANFKDQDSLTVICEVS